MDLTSLKRSYIESKAQIQNLGNWMGTLGLGLCMIGVPVSEKITNLGMGFMLIGLVPFFRECPQGSNPVDPSNFLPFIVGSARIGDRDFIDPISVPEEFIGHFHFKIEAPGLKVQRF